ncbi:MAG: hypothetical protein CME70_04265 [Halobacteriovorax sp.]|nr:hypothetical protein [Halobacteriovorax sp.]|tara:strand:+ start:56565 stop:56987 length:423 start_codon:yes stop_codon:yes gene_type:complete
MQMTPLETQDLYEYLNENSLWTEALVQRLNENIVEFRLDKEISTGRNTSFRRSYTCPFFKHESLGCPIPPEVKPYGCLAFNAISSGVSDGENCKSDLDLLSKRESEDEDKLNKELTSLYGLYWEKLPIPMALLEWDKLPN